eukprot:3698724-Heterocapsa_arctica.AAC.1
MKLKYHDAEVKLKSSVKGRLIIPFTELDNIAEWSGRATVLVAATFADAVLPHFGKTEDLCVDKDDEVRPSTSSPSPSTPSSSPSVLKGCPVGASVQAIRSPMEPALASSSTSSSSNIEDSTSEK